MWAEGHGSCKLHLKSQVCQQAAFTTTSGFIGGLGLLHYNIPRAEFSACTNSFTALGIPYIRTVVLQKFPLSMHSGLEFIYLNSENAAL